MFSLCIPTMDRFDTFLSKFLVKYLNNEYINEIIITDENGNENKLDDETYIISQIINIPIFKIY